MTASCGLVISPSICGRSGAPSDYSTARRIRCGPKHRLDLSDIGGNFTRQRLPITTSVGCFNILQQFVIPRCGKFIPTQWRSAEIQIIRMHDQKRHTAVGGDPIELPLPNGIVRLAKNREEAVVLDERVRELNISGTVLAQRADQGPSDRSGPINPFGN